MFPMRGRSSFLRAFPIILLTSTASWQTISTEWESPARDIDDSTKRYGPAKHFRWVTIARLRPREFNEESLSLEYEDRALLCCLFSCSSSHAGLYMRIKIESASTSVCRFVCITSAAQGTLVVYLIPSSMVELLRL